MPPRRIFRRKQRTEPMSPFIWRFFLAESVQYFDQLAAVEGDNAGVFFLLYYDDGWRDVYAQHREEIEAYLMLNPTPLSRTKTTGVPSWSFCPTSRAMVGDSA